MTNWTQTSVEESNVEASIEAKSIGERIRRLRLKKSIGLIELGRRTGMSASFLSQLETGRVVPTLRNLSRISLVFNKDLSYFFADDHVTEFKKSRAADRIRLRMGKADAPFLVSESISALIPDRSLVPCIAHFLPNPDQAPFDPQIFAGQEFVYVIDGFLTVSTKGEKQVLGAADVAWIDGTAQRQYRCTGETPATALIVTCPKAN